MSYGGVPGHHYYPQQLEYVPQQQPVEAYYYGQQEQYQQQAEEENTIDARPPDITEQQDNIIQLVAKYVVFSCDGARYQHKLVSKTRFNSYFSFIASPQHKYHDYYQYLLRSYALWRDVAARSAGGQDAATADEGYAFYTEQLRQQEQQQMQYQASVQYAAQQQQQQQQIGSSHTTYTGTGVESNGYYDANMAQPYISQQQQQQQPVNMQESILGPSLSAHGEERFNGRKRERTPQESSEDDDDDGPELEFVMENGVARAIPKQN